MLETLAALAAILQFFVSLVQPLAFKKSKSTLSKEKINYFLYQDTSQDACQLTARYDSY